jgi:hypothetical protein
MPSISMFYGILVFLYFGNDDHHHAPHIHARYQNDKVAVAIEGGEVLAGSFPEAKLRMLRVWMDIHREELLADWELAKAGDTPFRIRPLE